MTEYLDFPPNQHNSINALKAVYAQLNMNILIPDLIFLVSQLLLKVLL